MQIANTGERILLEKETPLMIARHFRAYQFAKDYCAGKRILEVGCGEGYGSNFLAGFAKEITAVDYNKEAIDLAKSKYRRENLRYIVYDASDLGSMNGAFDVICSFQFIEHIDDTQRLLGSIRNLLSAYGCFICSTCNRKDASPGSVIPCNTFHVREYMLDEYASLMRGFFGSVEMFGVKRGKKLKFYRRLKKIGAFSFLPENLDPVKGYFRNVDYRSFMITQEKIEEALDFIAVCRR